MKHILLTSLTLAFCVAACGEKTHLELKARTMKEAQQKPGNTPAEKPTDDVEGALEMPTNADNRKILINGSATRNIFVGSEGITTTVFCAENLAKTQKEKEKIKIQGQSQIIVRQVVTIGIPEVDSLKLTKKEPPKALLNLACLGNSADLSKEPEDKFVTVTKLVVGASSPVIGKFSLMEGNYLSKAVVSCVTAKDMAKANESLMPAGKAPTSDIVMAVNSKMLLETSSDDPEHAKYVLVTCDEAPVEAPKAIAETVEVQE